MVIKHINFRHEQIPLKISFKQANQDTPVSNSIVLELHTETGNIGYGEACPRRYVTGESVASVLGELDKIVPYLIGQQFYSFREVKDFILKELALKLSPSSLCALDLALLDAFAKDEGVSLLELFGGSVRPGLEYSGVIPMGPANKLRSIVQQFQFSNVKIKVGTDIGESRERIEMVRELYGPNVPIRLDANTSWTYAQAVALIPQYLDMGISHFEQPLAKEKLEEMSWLLTYFGGQASLIADESLTTVESAFKLILRRSFNRFNLKISKHGGMLKTLQIYQAARMSHIPCQLGAHFGETSILSRAGILFACLAPEIEVIEGAFGTHLLERDVWEKSIAFNSNGRIDFPARHLQYSHAGTIFKPFQEQTKGQINSLQKLG